MFSPLISSFFFCHFSFNTVFTFWFHSHLWNKKLKTQYRFNLILPSRKCNKTALFIFLNLSRMKQLELSLTTKPIFWLCYTPLGEKVTSRYSEFYDIVSVITKNTPVGVNNIKNPNFLWTGLDKRVNKDMYDYEVYVI